MYELAQLAYLLEGVLDHSPEKKITGVQSLSEAGPDEISVVVTEKYLKDARYTLAGALILPIDGFRRDWPIPTIRVKEPWLAFIKVLEAFKPSNQLKVGIEATAYIGSDTVIGEEVSIGPHVYVGPNCLIGNGVVIQSGVHIGAGVKIGQGCIIYSNTVIEDRVQIGNKVIIRANSVIGSEGFGFVSTSSGHKRIPHIGSVVIHDEVEIGANVTVDAGTCGNTCIGRGTKIGNRTQISHNVWIGEDCLIVGQSGIAGSSCLGNRVIMAGQSGVVEHVKIGDYVTIMAKSLVTKDVPDSWCVSGVPARPHKEQQQVLALTNQLPRLRQELKELHSFFTH